MSFGTIDDKHTDYTFVGKEEKTTVYDGLGDRRRFSYWFQTSTLVW